MLSELVKNRVDFDDAVFNAFFLSEDNEHLFQAYMLEYNKSILFLRFNDYVSETDRCDWLLKYCESLSEKVHSMQKAGVDELREQKLQAKNILLVLDRDFQRSLRNDSEELSKYKFLDNVLIKYSDRLSLSVGSIGGEVSLIEIMLRLHELYRYGEIKFLIINQFEKLVDVDEYLSNEAKSIVYSYIYSLISNIDVESRGVQELKILVID